MLGLGRPEKLNPYRALVMLLKLQPFPEGLGLLLVHSKCGCCCCFITSSMAIPPLDYCLSFSPYPSPLRPCVAYDSEFPWGAYASCQITRSAVDSRLG